MSENFKESKDIKESRSVQMISMTLGRIMCYTGVRIFTILLTIAVGVYLTLIIINLGGFVDDIFHAQIIERIGGMAMGGFFDDVPQEEYEKTVEDLQWRMAESMGLHEPLPIRTTRWWLNGVTLQLGEAERLSTLDGQSNLVTDIIFDRLPYTLLLVGFANVILFFTSIGVAMMLTNRRGNFWDQLLALLTPISSAPSWIHGVILLAIFALELRILPFKGIFDGATPEEPIHYIVQLIRHMVLPVSAIILSAFFQGVYTWRTFFIVHSGEDYVDLAKAKGLPDRVIRRRYLLRPTLPSVITSFAMMIVGFWEGAIALETFFNWPGLGALFLSAIRRFDRPVVVGIVAIFAYLLGLSVILLDIFYAIVDPRVRVGGNGGLKKIRMVKRGRIWYSFKALFGRENKRSGRDGNNPSPSGRTENNPSIEKEKTLKSSRFLQDIFHQIHSQIFKYPMAAAGLVIIICLIILSAYTMIAIPYEEAVTYWNSSGWLLAPKLAQPSWTNIFRRNKWPESIYFDSTKATEGVRLTTEYESVNKEITETNLRFSFDYTADEFPQDLAVYFDAVYEEKRPFASIIFLTPDGRELEIENFSLTSREGYVLSYENLHTKSAKKLLDIEQIFGDPKQDFSVPLKGVYTLLIQIINFEEDSTVDVQATIHGKVYGLFGTDSERRDLTTAMLWGTPVALMFGVIGAVVTTTSTIIIAAISAWFGGWLDELLQRITELNLILPALPIAIMIYMLYSKSIWVILSVMILLNIFGNSLKEYRAMFLQFKQAPYIEAAMAYGTSNRRIIFKYLLPRIIQVMVPQLVISVPSFVFLEVTLSYLGISMVYFPTWGKVINMALNEGPYWGHYFWVLEPIILVLITGLAFAFVGFALDKILNPRLRAL